MTNTELVAALAEKVNGVIRAERELNAQQIATLRAEFEALYKGTRTGRDGKDGEPGPAGPPGEPGPAGERGLQGEKGVDGRNGEKGIDGRDGRDGKDGIASFDEVKEIAAKAVDARLETEVEKRVTEAFASLPVLRYRGVYKQGAEYQPGECATFGGSLFHCNEPTTEKPETGKAWTLAVKRGRDGKDVR